MQYFSKIVVYIDYLSIVFIINELVLELQLLRKIKIF